MHLPALCEGEDIQRIRIADPHLVAHHIAVAPGNVWAVQCPPFPRPLPCEAQDLRRDLLPHSTLECCRRWERQRVLHCPFLCKLHAAFHAQLRLLQVDAAEHFPHRRVDAVLPLAGFAAVLYKAVPVARANGLPFAVQRCLADLQSLMPRLQPLDEIPVQFLSLAGATAELPPLCYGIHPERDLLALRQCVFIQSLAARRALARLWCGGCCLQRRRCLRLFALLHVPAVLCVERELF